MKNLPYPYYFFGSKNSIDEDVIISIPKEIMPKHQEARKELVFHYKQTYRFEYNATLAVVEKGIITDTIYPKTWVDSLNNALYKTYDFHLQKQQFAQPIQYLVSRNKLLSIYKTVRTVLSMFTRTHYRPLIKPYMKGCHDFQYKIEALKKINLMEVTSFNQRNARDIDIWKTIAFYVAQNTSLIQDNIEIYDKNTCLKYHPTLQPFINREPLGIQNIKDLEQYLKQYNQLITTFGDYQCHGIYMSVLDEKIDMQKEISL